MQAAGKAEEQDSLMGVDGPLGSRTRANMRKTELISPWKKVCYFDFVFCFAGKSGANQKQSSKRIKNPVQGGISALPGIDTMTGEGRSTRMCQRDAHFTQQQTESYADTNGTHVHTHTHNTQNRPGKRKQQGPLQCVHKLIAVYIVERRRATFSIIYLAYQQVYNGRYIAKEREWLCWPIFDLIQ